VSSYADRAMQIIDVTDPLTPEAKDLIRDDIKLY
jgi:hypothetical protein